MSIKINNEELFFNAFLFENSDYFISGYAYVWCVARVTCLVIIIIILTYLSMVSGLSHEVTMGGRP